MIEFICVSLTLKKSDLRVLNIGWGIMSTTIADQNEGKHSKTHGAIKP